MPPRPHRTSAPRGRADDPVALLRLIATRVRQRAFVVFDPSQIAHVDPAAARLASEKMLGLGEVPPIGALAEYRPAWSRFIE